MVSFIDKHARATLFRTRLAEAINASGMTQSALARSIGADRSTLSQALTDSGARMPGAHVIGACASVLGVSSDWLLGLSDRPESAADLLSNSFEVSHAPRALVDEQIFAWHREAAGSKIRHVPATLPDMLKTDEMLEWEYGPHLGRTTQQAINASRDRLDWMRQVGSEYEIAMPLYEITCFIRGAGYYAGLPAPLRIAQTDHLITLSRQLYPRMRIYQFDARRLYSAPVTVFGRLLAVIYTGGHYMAFRDRNRIDTLMTDFDVLVVEASRTARDFPDYLSDMRALIR
ncbi:helix-turn-helix domain-containing protein [Sulfitobacter sp. TSTF-M16]|uniref:Helix-turn-helix domain-containing protein n=1 Tax=Sulfitobacter aestuariivivens TaxID=2766981 RepID=A0A927CZW4_9RHOB|nr:helix-turn-helix domain-containing protein [Sulfitobacter aestuariivivens]MBD3662493.1 helix-turn-helix domain-containing protein [Sulfitobacter aestuariivivens]